MILTDKKDLSEYRRKYNVFRHHAWAGLGFLSVTLAIRIILVQTPVILDILIFALVFYIVFALILTYKYRAGLSSGEKITQVRSSDKIEMEKLRAGVEKERLKIEKKIAKAEVKKAKKVKK